ncbi:MAG: hypothetical protein MZV64_16590 [Ignavibacteriales bacterium]|nr:hypothetical protein [Ignavibacteriales bacterium]
MRGRVSPRESRGLGRPGARADGTSPCFSEPPDICDHGPVVHAVLKRGSEHFAPGSGSRLAHLPRRREFAETPPRCRCGGRSAPAAAITGQDVRDRFLEAGANVIQRPFVGRVA